MKGQLLIRNLPLLRQIKKLPFAAALAAAVIVAIHFFPAFVFFGGIPDNLRVRADQQVVPPALQFFALGAVYYFIIVPFIG